MKPSMNVVIGGSDKGSVAVTGPANAKPLEQGKPVDLSDMTGTYKPGASGTSTLSPGTLTIDVNLGGQKIVIPCEVKERWTHPWSSTPRPSRAAPRVVAPTLPAARRPRAAARTPVAASPTPGPRATALRALGLVAGTAILLGGAVFTFTRGASCAVSRWATEPLSH
ncbi:hypothetical protein NKH18_20285 [Streptomyces sp. M10(2022)]